MHIKRFSAVFSLCGAALISAADAIDLAVALDPGADVKPNKIVDAVGILTGHMNDSKFLAFINLAHQYKPRTRASAVARRTAVGPPIDSNDALRELYEKIRDMAGEAASVKAPVFRAFVSYYRALCGEVDTLGVHILKDLDLDTAGLYLTLLTEETEEIPPKSNRGKWLNLLEERVESAADPGKVQFLRETALKVLMNQTRQHLLNPPRSRAPGASGSPCPTIGNRKRLLYMEITDEHRQSFLSHLTQMRDAEALRAYFKMVDGSTGCLLRGPTSTVHSLDAMMTLMSPSSGPPNKDLDAFGKSARKDLKELVLSTSEGGLADTLCREIMESDDNRLKFLLFLTLHPDQGLAIAIRNDFFLKRCSSAGFAKKFEETLANFFDGTSRPPSVDLLADLKGRGFMNIEDLQLEDELRALATKFAESTTSTMGPGLEKLAPTLFREPRRPQMLELFPRLYAAAKLKLETKASTDKKKLVEKFRENTLEILDQIRKREDENKMPVIYQEGMIVDMVRKSLNTGDLNLFEILCLVPKADAPRHGHCYGVPLRLIERFQADVLAAAAKDGGRPNTKTAELLQAYRKDLAALNARIKAQHAPKAESGETAGGGTKPAAAGFMSELMAGGGKGDKRKASSYGLMDLAGVVKDYDLDLRRALRLLTDRVLMPLRMDLIDWRGQELLDSATAEEEDLLSTLLAYAVQLKDLQMIYQIISKPGLKPSFQFTQGFQLLIGSLLLALAQEDCREAKGIRLAALNIELQPLTALQEKRKAECTQEAAGAEAKSSAAVLPPPSTGEPPREFSALSKPHEPSVAESLLELLCDKFHCPFHRLEGDCVPQIDFAAVGATDQLPKLEPPRDGFAEQWLHRMVQLIALEKEAGAKVRELALKTPLEAFFMSAIAMLAKYMTFDPHANGDLIAFILEMARQ